MKKVERINVIEELLARRSFFDETDFAYEWGRENQKLIKEIVLDKNFTLKSRAALLTLLNSESFFAEFSAARYGHIDFQSILKYTIWFTKRNGFSLFVREYGREYHVYRTGDSRSFSDFSFNSSYDLMSEFERGFGRRLKTKEVNEVIELFIKEIEDTKRFDDPIHSRMIRKDFIGSFLSVFNMGIILDKTNKKNKKKMIQILIDYDWGRMNSIVIAMAFAESMGEQLSKHQILTWIRTNDFSDKN